MPGDDPATITRPSTCGRCWRAGSRPTTPRWNAPPSTPFTRGGTRLAQRPAADRRRRGAPDAALHGPGHVRGVRDAANLAWKLADVVQVWRPTRCSTATRRALAARARVHRDAVRLGGIIQATDPAQVARRNAEMTASPQVFHTPQPALARAPRRRRLGRPHRAAAVVRRRQPLRRRGRLPLCAGGAARSASRGDRAGRRPCGGRAATNAPLQAWLAGFDAAAVLVRPDRYVPAPPPTRPTLRTLLQRQLGGLAA